MNTRRLFCVCVLVSFLSAVAVRADEPTDEKTAALLQGILDAYEREAVVIQAETSEARTKLVAETMGELATLQSRYARDGKLDEAVAIRDQVRWLTESVAPSKSKLPADAAALLTAHEKRLVELTKQESTRITDVGKRVASPLKEVVDRLCREEKLDEALAVRDVLLRLTGESQAVEQDPGALYVGPNDIGKTRYFEIVGHTDGQVWGTDVYTGDSSLASAAVHAGAVRDGEKAVVRVKMLPGQNMYGESSRNGVTSHAYGTWSGSFSVERAYGNFHAAAPAAVPAAQPAANPFGR